MQRSHMYFGLLPDLVPDGFELGFNHGVKILELGIPDIDVVQVEVLVLANPSITYQRMISLDLHQHRLCAGCNAFLALPHKVCHGLIHLDDFSLPGGQRILDSLVISEDMSLIVLHETDLPRPNHRIGHIQIHQHVL
jgi:hypothetical protein